MREVTQKMIKDFKITQKGYDFMGYAVGGRRTLSFHHLIISHRESKAYGIGEGYLYWNGAILNGGTSHPYLHIVESKDMDRFLAITSEMIDENLLGRLDIQSLRRIRDILEGFEREHSGDTTRKGKQLIKEEFVRSRLKL